MQLQIPAPGDDALASSQVLCQLVADDIEAAGGWISFSRYMERILYAPIHGYYSGGATKLGKDGDFTTAPEISPLFGATLAHVLDHVMQQTQRQLLEFGAGSGKLAFDILNELAGRDALPEAYYIIELSSELRDRQQSLLKDFPQVQWLDTMPGRFDGVVIGNEVLDAMPVSLVVRQEDGWYERGVMLDAQQRFAFADRPCPASLLAQVPEHEALPPGYLTEVHPVATGFMHAVSAMLQKGEGGAAIFIDYGFPAHEYYLDDRHQGTLMCHYRHHAHADPFYLPGLQDVTSHVDFTAMARAALEEGLDVLGYTSQAAFLMAAGIGDVLLRTPPEQARDYLPQARAVQKLLLPAEMGELFKVLAVGKGVAWPEALLAHDRMYRL